MDITIKTKFGFQDKPYGYCSGGWFRFRIDKINVRYNIHPNGSIFNEVEYECTAIVPKDWEMTFGHTFEEEELHTKDEIVSMLERIKDSDL